mgnify:CR=1 FL=1
MSDDRYLTFALGKGRLAKKTLQLFEQIGITCEEMKDPDTRKLIFVNEELKLDFSWQRDLMCYIRGVWRCRYRCGRKGYHPRGGQKYIRGA